MSTPKSGPGEMSGMSRVLLRLLVRLYPKGFRAEFEEEWRRFIEQQRREEKYRRRLIGPLRFWKDVLVDVVRSSARVRREDIEGYRGK